MDYIEGDGRRDQGSLFPVILDDFAPADHVCRVVDAFVAKLAMSELGFERTRAAETGRPGYDPRSLLNLYLYGYLNRTRSSRRLEADCRRSGRVDVASRSPISGSSMHSRVSSEGREVLNLVLAVQLCPANKLLQSWLKRLSQSCEPVFHFGWNFLVDGALHHFLRLEIA